MFVQFAVDVVAVVARPICQVYLVGRRFYHQREKFVFAELALADGIEVRKINCLSPNRSE
jgi:hypothetical protein